MNEHTDKDKAISDALDALLADIEAMFNPVPETIGGMTYDQLADGGWQFRMAFPAYESNSWKREVELVNGDGSKLVAKLTNDQVRRLLTYLPLNGESPEEAGLEAGK